MSKKILIVGGVAGGATAAARLRRQSETDEIIMFERGEFISFANCGLPYYIGEVITDRDKLLVQTVEGMSKRFNLDIRNFSEVTSINQENKTVTVKNIQTNETYEESFDKLILSPGAKPIVPPIPGLNEAKSIFTLRNIPDTDAIYEFIKENNPNHATVIGGGFIGVEMAENLRERGIEVTLVDLADQIMAPVDFEMAQMLHDECVRHNVELILNDGVKSFKDEGSIVETNSGIQVKTDLIILAIGVAPETKLATDAGLEIGETRGIKVNDYLQTSNEDIYAVGDAIEVKHFITGTPSRIPLAWPANRQGVLVADHINGGSETYKGTLGTSVAKVFDYTVSSTGLNEKQLKNTNIEYTAFHINRNNHAGYYPGATAITMKVIFETETGKLLGAQAVGKDGTEKRIDVISALIKMGGKINDLVDFEPSYAPPFGSAKDPVNIAGYVAKNIDQGVYNVVHWNEIDDIISKGGYLLDVRTPLEYSLGAIKGSTNIELDELRNHLNELPIDKAAPIYVTCQVGHRGYLAVRILRENGYTNIFNLSGGYKVYSTATNKDHHEIKRAKLDDIDTSYAEHINEDNKEYLKINTDQINVNLKIDATGLQCPGPILETYKGVEKLKDGQVARVTASDFGFYNDIESWTSKTGNTLVSRENIDGTVVAYVKKGQEENSDSMNEIAANIKDNATIVLFSGEFDKALAALIIANGAAAMGKKVSIFATFWGLNALRKKPVDKVTKSGMETMFDMMLPKSANELPLSNMNMMGMGKSMMEKIMKDKNVDSIDKLMQDALDLGVKFIACTMSMDVMGIKKEEIIEEADFGGVASYLSDAHESGLTLFI
jgi:CoA-disulfide reductase